jgi:hypothetical protein
VILLVLAYVTVDLCCPSIPGVFVFDAERSVVGASSGAGRVATTTCHQPGPTPHRRDVFPSYVQIRLVCTVPQTPRPGQSFERLAVYRLARACCSVAPPSPDAEASL